MENKIATALRTMYILTWVHYVGQRKGSVETSLIL